MGSNLPSSILTDWPVDAIPKSSIDALFDRLHGFYGSKFLDMWAHTDLDTVKRIWATEIKKLTVPQMKQGYDQLAKRKFPPTLPEFIELCRPSLDSTAAYYEAVNGLHARDRGEMGNWSHPAIFWASAKMAFDLKSMAHSAIKGRWEAALQAEMDKSEWAAIPQPAPALPAPGKADLSREKAAQMLAELGASGLLKPSTDDKRWARKIMQRVADGDKTLSALQVRFAREALTGKAAA